LRAFRQIHDGTHTLHFGAETGKQWLPGLGKDVGGARNGFLQRYGFAIDARAGRSWRALEKGDGFRAAFVGDFQVARGVALDGQIVAKQAAERTGYRFYGGRLSKIIHGGFSRSKSCPLLDAGLR
jgi:hypothetical protein